MGLGEILTIIKLSTLRFLTKRPYGLAYFKVNKNLFNKIIRFDKETIRTKDGIWTFDKDLIYVEKDSVKTMFKQSEFLEWKSGYPIIFLDQNNMQPTGFTGDAPNPTNPRNIQSILNKEISAFEAELMRKQRGQLEKLLYAAIFLAAISAILSYIAMNDIGVVKEMVSKIPITTTGLNG